MYLRFKTEDTAVLYYRPMRLYLSLSSTEETQILSLDNDYCWFKTFLFYFWWFLSQIIQIRLYSLFVYLITDFHLSFLNNNFLSWDVTLVIWIAFCLHVLMTSISGVKRHKGKLVHQSSYWVCFFVMLRSITDHSWTRILLEKEGGGIWTCCLV